MHTSGRPLSTWIRPMWGRSISSGIMAYRTVTLSLTPRADVVVERDAPHRCNESTLANRDSQEGLPDLSRMSSFSDLSPILLSPRLLSLV
ncbi:unnamed protein product [Amoebophrya sp. A25]|nr:unnamed protein product [Amoebophrya sp. A25]|eukprot:GSA25T00001425001.1